MTKERKYTTLFQIKCRQEPASFDDVLERLFYRDITLVDHAKNFLGELKAGPFHASKWKAFSKKEFKNLPTETQRKNRFYAIIQRLRGAGIIYKREEEWRLQDNFAEYLKLCARLYENWRKSE